MYNKKSLYNKYIGRIIILIALQHGSATEYNARLHTFLIAKCTYFRANRIKFIKLFRAKHEASSQYR